MLPNLANVELCAADGTSPLTREDVKSLMAAAPEITYEFKREVASYAAKYINQYRGSSCTILPGMSQVAQYRAGQLTRNYGHSTADKRAALAHLSMADTSMPPSSVMTPAIPTGKQTLPRPSVPASTARIPRPWARRSLT